MTTKQGRGIKVKFNLFRLRRQLEIEKGHSLTWEDVAKGAGLHINTIYGLSTNSSKRIDIRTMEKLIEYFKKEGLPVGPGDLFTFGEEEEQPADQVTA